MRKRTWVTVRPFLASDHRPSKSPLTLLLGSLFPRAVKATPEGARVLNSSPVPERG